MRQMFIGSMMLHVVHGPFQEETLAPRITQLPGEKGTQTSSWTETDKCRGRFEQNLRRPWSWCGQYPHFIITPRFIDP